MRRGTEITTSAARWPHCAALARSDRSFADAAARVRVEGAKRKSVAREVQRDFGMHTLAASRSLVVDRSHEAAAEVRRVRAHIAGAEAMMRARDVSHLSSAQRTMRAFLVEELRRYRERGVFPKNHVARELTPQFVDDHGVRCAMAHLLEVTGFGHVVERVRRTKNDVRIRELAHDPDLLAWLVAVGMTLEEAARVQPSYCFEPKGECLCIGAHAEAVIEATVIAAKTTGKFEVRVDAVHGTTTQVKVGDRVEGYGSALGAGEAVLGSVRPRPAGSSDPVADGGGPDAGTSPLDIGLHKVSKALACGQVSASKQDVIEAWLAKDCLESLKAKSSLYGEPSCDDDGMSIGCHAAARGPSDVMGIILVLAAAWALRRRARA